MHPLAKIIFQADDEVAPEEMSQEDSYYGIHGLMTWNDEQYAAWVAYGVTSIIASLYWT